MSTLDNLVQEFLAQKIIAVVGISDKRETHGSSVIPGSCPAQFLKADYGHNLTRRLWGTFAYLNVKRGTQ